VSKFERETIEKHGIDMNALIDKLRKAAASEMLTYYYYTLIRYNLAGPDAEAAKEIAEDARLEDRCHFEILVQRIYELGGECYNTLRELEEDARCKSPYLPESRDTKSLLQVLLNAERCAEGIYHDLCDYTFGKDPVTYDYSLAILHEEVEHEAWFEELLGMGKSGHFRRRFPGESPFTEKFRHIEER
jgi:ferritin-like protein